MITRQYISITTTGSIAKKKMLDMSKHDSKTTQLNTRYKEASGTKKLKNMSNNQLSNIKKTTQKVEV